MTGGPEALKDSGQSLFIDSCLAIQNPVPNCPEDETKPEFQTSNTDHVLTFLSQPEATSALVAAVHILHEL